MRKNPTFDGRVGEGFGYDARNSYPGGAHARGRSSAGRNVELPVAGAARARGPSAASDPGDGGHGPGRTVPGVAKLYSPVGRPSIPPEKLLRALLLQVLYSTRSEQLLMEQLDYNLLFRWFVGLNMDDAVWDPTVFTKNRERLLAGDIAQAFFTQVLAQARQRNLLSDE